MVATAWRARRRLGTLGPGFYVRLMRTLRHTGFTLSVSQGATCAAGWGPPRMRVGGDEGSRLTVWNGVMKRAADIGNNWKPDEKRHSPSHQMHSRSTMTFTYLRLTWLPPLPLSRRDRRCSLSNVVGRIPLPHPDDRSEREPPQTFPWFLQTKPASSRTG